MQSTTSIYVDYNTGELNADRSKRQQHSESSNSVQQLTVNWTDVARYNIFEYTGRMRTMRYHKISYT